MFKQNKGLAVILLLIVPMVSAIDYTPMDFSSEPQISQGTLSMPSESPLPEGRIILTTTGSAVDYTPTQKNLLQATLDDLCKIDNKRTAVDLNNAISNGHVTFNSEMPTGTLATTKCPALGYVDPISSNELEINQFAVDSWDLYKRQNAKAQENGITDPKKTEELMTIRDLAFTMIHEDVHMKQYGPQEIPYYENDAYETAISEMRRVIKDDMQEMLDTELPGEQDKLNALIEDLEISKSVYKEKIDSMQSDAIANRKVDPEKFLTSQTDMETLIQDADTLIQKTNTVTQEIAGTTDTEENIPAKEYTPRTLSPPAKWLLGN